jgi:pSer/pThr/pTyr-binding forkhead associated (FHA) protein
MNAPTQPIARLRLPAGEVLLYPGQQVRLGRSPDNDVVLDDPKISRSHAEIAWDGSGFVLKDLGSSNGTFLNVTRLEGTAQALHHGDQISLSRLALVFEILAPQPSAGAEPGAPDGGIQGPCLAVAGGLDLGREFPLWGEVVTIGRDSREATWEVRLTDRSVSRPHARLELGEGGYYLVDLGSANGTQLNDRPVTTPTLLKEGDVIGVGETRLVFRT